jgi:hypothetical protein
VRSSLSLYEIMIIADVLQQDKHFQVELTTHNIFTTAVHLFHAL